MSNRHNALRKKFNGYVFELNSTICDIDIIEQLDRTLSTWANNCDSHTTISSTALCNTLAQMISKKTEILEKFEFSVTVRIGRGDPPHRCRFEKKRDIIIVSIYPKSNSSYIPDA